MALVRIGRMDRRVTLRKKVFTRGAAGAPKEEWQDLATVWAEKLDVRGREFIAAQQVNAETTTIFRIRYRTDVNPQLRLVCEGRDYDIISIAELGRHRHLEITANAVAAGDTADFEAD